MNDMRQAIAQNIVRLRTARGWTQAELAERLSYSDKAISKWERAESLPDIIVLKQLADLFMVRVDDLLLDEIPLQFGKKERLCQRNHIIITMLAVMLVWLVATFTFVILGLIPTVRGKWLVFLYAVPASAIVLIVFNSIWGRRRLNYLIISVLVWSLLLCTHFSVFYAFDAHLWLVYVLGIPAQIIILLWSGLKNPRKAQIQEEKENET